MRREALEMLVAKVADVTQLDRFHFEIFLTRAALLQESSHAVGLPSRVRKLAERLRTAGLHDLERAVFAFLKTLPS